MIKSKFINKDVQKYVNVNCIRLTPVQRKLHEQSMGLGDHNCEHERSVDCSQLLQILVKTSHSKNCLEVGALTGYNAVTMAMATPSDGKVITVDLTENNMTPLKNIWKEAGVEHKIEVRLGDATKVLENLVSECESGMDLILIDCDRKHVYSNYEKCLRLLKNGGIMVINGVLCQGDVSNNDINNEEVKAMRELNLKLKVDDRIELMSTLTLGSGLTVLVKKD